MYWDTPTPPEGPRDNANQRLILPTPPSPNPAPHKARSLLRHRSSTKQPMLPTTARRPTPALQETATRHRPMERRAARLLLGATCDSTLLRPRRQRPTRLCVTSP